MIEPKVARCNHIALLQEIPGVDWTLAAVIIAELGIDMSVFQSVSQLASWAGVCPGNNESASKRKSAHIPKGNVYLKTALVEAANAAARTKGTYLRDKFYHKILVSIYDMFSQQVSYKDLACIIHQRWKVTEQLLESRVRGRRRDRIEIGQGQEG